MINNKQLRELVIQPALKGINLYSPGAEELLIGTCAQESQDGFYIKQTVGGIHAALGIYQMQPETHDDIWKNTLTKGSVNTDLAVLVMNVCRYPMPPKAEVMVYNLLYASVMARIFWLHVKEPMPAVDDIDHIWSLYKKYWNTEEGKATKEEFVRNYHKFGKGE